jgi:hypothetical protein
MELNRGGRQENAREEGVQANDFSSQPQNLGMENLAQTEPKPVFANERTRIAWEIGRAIERLTPEIEPEGIDLKLKPITFDKEHKTKGTYAILMAGTVGGTGREGVLEVPERTLSILEKLGIPYRIEQDKK